MDLFSPNSAKNLLPCDGETFYHGPIMTATQSDELFDELLKEIPWEHDQVRLFGKTVITARQVAWFGGKNFAYTYSGHTREARRWTPALRGLKKLIQSRVPHRFNSCLLNLYHSGEEGMGWHSDDEKSLIGDSAIASISLGAERPFALKHKTLEHRQKITLEDGSLLLMAGATQRHWLHSLPKSKKITQARINLTFRQMKE